MRFDWFAPLEDGAVKLAAVELIEKSREEYLRLMALFERNKCEQPHLFEHIRGALTTVRTCASMRCIATRSEAQDSELLFVAAAIQTCLVGRMAR